MFCLPKTAWPPTYGKGLITDPPHIVDALEGKTGTWLVHD